MTQTETPKPHRRRRGFEPAGALIAGDIKGPAAKRGFADARLLTHWAEIMGDDIAAIARPVKISHGRGLGGTLVVLTTGGHAPVVEMQKDRIIDRANAAFGYRAVSRVQVTQTAPTGFAEGQVAFRTAPARVPEPDEAMLDRARPGLDEITDTGLRSALTRLARNIATPQKR